MRTDLIFNKGKPQVVFTPDSNWEKKVLESFPTGGLLEIRRGHYYECQGDFLCMGSVQYDEPSVILILKEAQP